MARTSNNLLGTTKNGFPVYDRIDSHFHSEGGLTLDLLKEGLQKIHFNPWWRFRKFELDFHRPIGLTTCVEVDKNDEVVMVYRKGRPGQTPMVRNRDPQTCEWMTVILKKDDEDRLMLVTAFIGAGSTPEPWDRSLQRNSRLRREAELFWSTHALIYDETLVDWDRTQP